MRAGMDVARSISRMGLMPSTRDDQAVTRGFRAASEAIGIRRICKGRKFRTGTRGRHSRQLRTDNVSRSRRATSPNQRRREHDLQTSGRGRLRGDRILLATALSSFACSRRRRIGALQCRHAENWANIRVSNLPALKLRIPAVTARDHDDLRFALRHGANFVAVSFVRSAADGASSSQRSRCAENVPASPAEKPEAIENLDEISRGRMA